MKKTRKVLTAVFAVCCFFSLLLITGRPAEAASASGAIPTASDNLTVGLRSTSELVPVSSGYMRVFYNGEKVCIEYYDNNFVIQKKQSLAMELDIWGGFYAGSDGYYLVEGRNNKSESDTAEVIRVIKYDENWNKKGTAKITGNPGLFGGEVKYPFDYGCVEMAEYNDTLYIVTGHEGYAESDGSQGHQGFLMLAVDKTSMKGEIVDSDFGHSFAQYIACKDSSLYVLEQSEGSRCTMLTKYNAENLESKSFPVLRYGGSRNSEWAIECYASVDGLAISDNYVLGLGTSIDQSQYDNVSAKMSHNVYLTITPISDFSKEATTVKWITSYGDGSGKCFLGTKITKVNGNRFLITWEEFETEQTAGSSDSLSSSILHYVFVDGQGNKISREFTAAAPVSDCQPVVKGSKIVYYASSGNMVDFYSIDASSGKFSKKIYRVAGANATWTLKDGVLTISGTGMTSVDKKVHYRYPVSSTRWIFNYSLADNTWKAINSRVKKLVIEKGITGISERSFAGFEKLTEVNIASGVKNIGKEAFYGCDSLRKITIPSSVTSIGDDILWTGYYWGNDLGHVVEATIYAPYGSKAIQYAKANDIYYQIDLSKAEVSGIRSSYVYTGKPQKPKVTVKLGGKTLKPGGDYTVFYANNTKTGTATVTIKGVGYYYGTIKKTFRIIPQTDISGAGVSGVKSACVYSGKAWKQAVKVKLGSKTLKSGTDYTVSYANNVKVGIATVTIKGVNNYKGTIKKTFRIIPRQAALSKAVSTKTGTITVNWKKDSQAGGYQLQCALNSGFTSGLKTVTIAKQSTTSKTITNLTQKKTYYVRIRAYKKIDGRSYYGAWSKVLKVTCK